MKLTLQYLITVIPVVLCSTFEILMLYKPDFDELNVIPRTRIIQSRITGGVEATPHAYPYTVGLLILKYSGKTVWCGGALISPEWVLTAAHCIKKGHDVMVHIGCHDRTKNCYRVKTNATSIIRHERYNGRSLANDIALIKLPDSMVLDDKVQTISLPEQNHRMSYEGKWATAAGWGIYSDSMQRLSNVLRAIQVPIISRLSCQTRYSTILIRETNICAASPNRRSTCAGDSGGPLILNSKGFGKVLIGITSFGHKTGCERGWPAVFTKVASYVDWIREQTGIYEI